MTIQTERLQDGRWTAWIDGTCLRATGRTLLEVLGRLVFDHAEKFSVQKFERVFVKRTAA